MEIERAEPSSERKSRSGLYLLLFLGGSLFLFVLVLIAFAALWQGDEEGAGSGFAGFSTKKNSIGIVEITGAIFYADDIVDQLEKYRKNDKIEAVVLRVDSPGGAVAPSQEIHDEILRIRDEGKPVVVSFASLGASGAYYLAAAADRIVANPGTLTGSIGVIMEFANVEELLGKIGVKAVTIKNSRGRYKDIGSPSRPLKVEERELLETLMDDVYEQFVEAVAYGRDLSVEEVYPLADGRIFTGQQAFDAGLVDDLGGFEVAVSIAAELAGIEGEPNRVYPREPTPTLFDLLEGSTEGMLNRFFPGIATTPARMSGGMFYLFVP